MPAVPPPTHREVTPIKQCAGCGAYLRSFPDDDRRCDPCRKGHDEGARCCVRGSPRASRRAGGPMRNRQIGPDDSAAILADLVPRVAYKPSWSFRLEEISRGQGSEGLTLVISFTSPDSLDPTRQTPGVHLMPVLPAAYDRESWQRWIFEQIELVERHEAMEFFQVDEDRPYFPEHAPGRNPYTVALVKSQEQIEEPAAPWHGGAARDEHFSG